MKRLHPLAFALFIACALAAPAAENSLTGAEKSAGWQLLFDGQTFNGWRGYLLEGMPATGWAIADGTMKTVARVKGGPIVTGRKFTDFELSWDWRLAEAGNNGVKYFVTEDRPKSPGHEYQMIDDERHPDGRIGSHRQTGSFYDVLPPTTNRAARPVGEWNTSRIVVKGRQVEHWLNGQRVLAYELGSAAVKAGLAKSKFTTEAGFGDKVTGPIMLTYHEDECWYRNIKIRELK